jgi:hypothetical protein
MKPATVLLLGVAAAGTGLAASAPHGPDRNLVCEGVIERFHANRVVKGRVLRCGERCRCELDYPLGGGKTTVATEVHDASQPAVAWAYDDKRSAWPTPTSSQRAIGAEAARLADAGARRRLGISARYPARPGLRLTAYGHAL